MRNHLQAFILIAAWLCLGVVACERDRISGSGDNDPVPSQTDEERAASVARMLDVVASVVPDHQNPPADANEQIAAAFLDMPELAEAEAIPGGVWARFHDGEELFVFNNRVESDVPEDAVSPDSSDYLGEAPGALDPLATGALLC